MSWDPATYLRYADERTRPALDLLARVPLAAPARVVDLGCGAGNITALLHRRFPAAQVLGVDSSPAMLARARSAAPDCRFAHADLAHWQPETPPDLLYSNAALHWLDGHETLLPRLFGTLAPGGALAVQMPAMHAAPIRALQHEVAATGPWRERLAAVAAAPPILPAERYWDLLTAAGAVALDVWETTYLHALTGEDAPVRWAMGSSLRPFLALLAGDEREAFIAAYRARVDAAYPRRPDGTTLLPFRRLFLIACKPA
jgi:trans-aconitate 2-methyltransferase